MPLQVEINNEFEKAINLLENSKEHLFITGKAGTGKSTLLNYAYEHTKKSIVLLAPTGVAALNIKGQTIHRFFGFPVNITCSRIENDDFKPRSVRILKHIDTIIIDEASMLRTDLLDCIDILLRKYGTCKDKAFGGVQMVFVGDLYQLPPVINSQEKSLFFEQYQTPYFFGANVFRQIPLNVIELKKIYRQKDDEFIALLNNIRNNVATKEDLQKLNSRVGANIEAKGADKFKITLTTTNQSANKLNQTMLDAIDGNTYISEAVIEGDFSSEYYPAAEQLEFKIGSQIMFLNNDSKNRWVNGSIGHITKVKFKEDKLSHIEVRLQAGQKLVAVFPHEWEVSRYKLEGKEIISEVVGTFTQFPIRLAWAVTIHKSQGKTFDNVEIDIGQGTFAAGQLYVALSRCTSFEGICLKKAVSQRNVMVDEQINVFLCQYCSTTAMPDRLKLQNLIQGINSRQAIEIIYQKTDGKSYKRCIIPQKIKGNMLIAQCAIRQELRSFDINRIVNIIINK